MLAYAVVAAIVTVAASTTSLWVAAILGAAIAAAWAGLEWLTKPWPVVAKADDDTIAYAFTRRDMARQFAFVNRVVLD